MYAKKELKRSTDIIKRIAHKHNVPEERVRADMREAMNVGRNNPNPAIQAQWATFAFAGEEPTVEEFILWVASQIKR